MIKNHIFDGNEGDSTIEFSNWITEGEVTKPIKGPLAEKIVDLSFLEKVKNPVTNIQCDFWKVPTHLNSNNATLYMKKYIGLFLKKSLQMRKGNSLLLKGSLFCWKLLRSITK